MGNEGSFVLHTQTWGRDSHGLFDYDSKKWQLDDIKLTDNCLIVYRAGDTIKLISEYSKLSQAREKFMKDAPEDGQPEEVHFSVLGYIICTEEGYKISSINHYNTYFKHMDVLKDKFEQYNYSDYGDPAALDQIGVDRYWKDIWRVARDPKTLHSLKFKVHQKHQYLGELIQPGDIIKIGRIKFKLRKYDLWVPINKKEKPRSGSKTPLPGVGIAEPQMPGRYSQLLNKNFKKEMFVQTNEEIPPCRFWLSNEMDDDSNPLINPWMCKGTMGLLHIDCMKYWLNTKKTVKEYNDGTCIIYTWKIVSCELCKQPYPHTIHFKDKSVWILEYDEPKNQPYIILESYPKEGSRNETQKSIYVCKTKGKKNLKLGRAQTNDLRVHDISISRNHAEINISKEGQLYIRDIKSKFGTLVLVKTPETVLNSANPLAVFQIGRSVFLFNNSINKSGGFACGLCKKFSKSKTSEEDEPLPVDNKYVLILMNFRNNADKLLEIEVEKLQKNNDSEFYLDDEFYERLADEFNKKQNPPIGPDEIILNEENDEKKGTEVEDDGRDEEEEDPGQNPFAMTCDGKNKQLQRELTRFQEEEKRLSDSISINNLELRIDTNAPQFRGTIEARPVPLTASPMLRRNEDEEENVGSKSLREIPRRDLEIIVPQENVEERARKRRRRVCTPKLQ